MPFGGNNHRERWVPPKKATPHCLRDCVGTTMPMTMACQCCGAFSSCGVPYLCRVVPRSSCDNVCLAWVPVHAEHASSVPHQSHDALPAGDVPHFGTLVVASRRNDGALLRVPTEAQDGVRVPFQRAHNVVRFIVQHLDLPALHFSSGGVGRVLGGTPALRVCPSRRCVQLLHSVLHY